MLLKSRSGLRYEIYNVEVVLDTYVVIHNDAMVLIEWPIRAGVFNLHVTSECKIDE